MTVELALAMPALFVVLGVVLWAVAAAGLRMDCTDAARAGARAAARGDSDAAVRELVGRVGPRGARLVLARHGEMVTVVVIARAAPPGPLDLPGLTVRGTASAEAEK